MRLIPEIGFKINYLRIISLIKQEWNSILLQLLFQRQIQSLPAVIPLLIRLDSKRHRKHHKLCSVFPAQLFNLFYIEKTVLRNRSRIFRDSRFIQLGHCIIDSCSLLKIVGMKILVFQLLPSGMILHKRHKIRKQLFPFRIRKHCFQHFHLHPIEAHSVKCLAQPLFGIVQLFIPKIIAFHCNYLRLLIPKCLFQQKIRGCCCLLRTSHHIRSDPLFLPEHIWLYPIIKMAAANKKYIQRILFHAVK